MMLLKKNAVWQSISPRNQTTDAWYIYGAVAVKFWTGCRLFHLSTNPIFNKKETSLMDGHLAWLHFFSQWQIGEVLFISVVHYFTRCLI